jgi:5-methyltetrahydrofolate--homocysteine methyltransferase
MTDPTAVQLARHTAKGKQSSTDQSRRRRGFESGADRATGAAIVVGHRRQGAGASVHAKKTGVAKRSYELLTKKYGMALEDIVFDPLVLPRDGR